MLHGHYPAIVIPTEGFNDMSIPLLDDEFDVGVEEMLDHSEEVLSCHHHPVTDDLI